MSSSGPSIIDSVTASTSRSAVSLVQQPLAGGEREQHERELATRRQHEPQAPRHVALLARELPERGHRGDLHREEAWR